MTYNVFSGTLNPTQSTGGGTLMVIINIAYYARMQHRTLQNNSQ